MGKTAIVSCYFKHNYGSALQAFATQYFLDSIGIENETINISENVDFLRGKKKYYLKEITNFSFYYSKLGMIKFCLDKKINKKLNNNVKIRAKKYEEFKNNIRLSKPYKTYDELTKACKNYNNVIVGGDQLWLPVNVVADYYTLNWVPSGINKVAFSTSFGVSEIPSKYKNCYKNFLNRLDNISVREDSGVKIVEELLQKKPFLSCDPTILLTKEDWMKIKKTSSCNNKEKYIFCYLLGNNVEHRKFAQRLKELTGYKIVSINHADEYVAYSDKFADITPYDVGPAQWIDLISNAEYVCTDSFHGIVFSLIFNKIFFAFERYKTNNSKISTNTRAYSLLKNFDLSDRLFKGNEFINEVLKSNIDFNKVNDKLENIRASSIEFLRKSLK